MKKSLNELSKRERQIMDVIYRRKSATVAEVRQDMPNPPGYSAVRAFLRILEEKNFLKHKKQGVKYVFSPTIRPKSAMYVAFRNLLETYFDNSIDAAVAAIIDIDRDNLSEKDYERLIDLINRAKTGKE
jgi:BlaI family transcriptional regulator, penicillinase repressor